MIAFITTIRHPHNSNDYERVGRLLTATLKSVLAQTDDDLVAIVVHNSKPTVAVSDSRIHYVEVDFPRPSAQTGPRIGYAEHLRDKGTKYSVGLAYAGQLGAGHVMFFDADDLVSNRIAAFANGQPRHPGWFFDTGYIHSVGTRSVQLVPSGFHRKNGSTSVIRADLVGLPTEVDTGSSQEDIYRFAGRHFVESLLGNHGQWQDHLAPSGHVMEPLPFPGAIWMIGTGENHSGNLISGRQRQPITPAITAEFGLARPALGSSFVASARIKIAQAQRAIRR